MRERAEKLRENDTKRWSLLTGPTSILAGIVGTVVVADLLFVENDWLRKANQRKQEAGSSTK